MPRGKKPAPEPLIQRHVWLPESLDAKLNLLLLNPTTGKVKYGARGDLINRLLQQYLSKREKKGTSNDGSETT